jgi:hypothetical protein
MIQRKDLFGKFKDRVLYLIKSSLIMLALGVASGAYIIKTGMKIPKEFPKQVPWKNQKPEYQ